jgi:hypothetical protein
MRVDSVAAPRVSMRPGSPEVAARDDRVLPETRWLAAAIVPVLVAAFVLLYLFPDHTDATFAWMVCPRMAPLIMGAGYIAGAYFFAHALLARRWHTVHLGFLPITVFTICMAIGTFLHLDQFHHGHISFYTWVFLYVVTPVLVPLAWLRNRRTDPRTPAPGDPVLSTPVRWAAGALGAAQLAIALTLLTQPDLMIRTWPWALTPLTAQTMSGWFALPGMVAVMMAVDPRWSAIRIVAQSQLIGLALILLAIPRAWDSFDRANPLTPAFIVGMGGLFLALLALNVAMELRLHTLARAMAPA